MTIDCLHHDNERLWTVGSHDSARRLPNGVVDRGEGVPERRII
jgi:hypothetical protein